MNLTDSEKVAQCKQIQEALRCMICVEYLENPHTLECGHSYCQGCLYQWLNNKKSCPECRLPVSRPPCPSYILQKIVNAFKPLVGIAVTQSSSNGDSSNSTSWRTLFPNYNPLGYFHDTSDGVARCASCLNELEPDGQCEHCNLQYDMDNEENGSVGNPIDLDMDTDMEHQVEDEYNDSDLEFLNDGEVEYDSDIGHDIDQYSNDDVFDDDDDPGSPTMAFGDDFDISAFDNYSPEDYLSDADAQLDSHDLDQYENDYEDDNESVSENILHPNPFDEYDDADDDVGDGDGDGDNDDGDNDDDDDDDGFGYIGVNRLRRHNVPRTIAIMDDSNDDDTSSSENSDDNSADYAGLADFKDEYGSANQRGILNRHTVISSNIKPTASTSSDDNTPYTGRRSKRLKNTAICLSSASENSDNGSDFSENTKHAQNDSTKKRRIILDTDDDGNDDDTLAPAIQHTHSINTDFGSSNGNVKGKGKNKDKNQVVATSVNLNTNDKSKKNRKKRRSKKNKKPCTMD